MANYFIIGDDEKEYGPVAEADMRKWVAENRIGPQTRVRAENTDEWRLLSEVPELGNVLKKTGPPPAIGALPATGKTSALAVTSLVMGILGLFTCGAAALIGLVLGIIALVRVSKSRGALHGGGIALAGIIVSAVFLFLIPISAAMLLPALAKAKQRAMQINCMSNEKQLALAVIMYSNDHTNHFPPAATWCEAIRTSVNSEKVFKCPAANASSRCDYAFNARLDGLDAAKIDPQTVVIFESDNGWDAHGGPELVASRHRGNSTIVAFADGHVELVAEKRLNSLRWEP